jgi:hypothetical protein
MIPQRLLETKPASCTATLTPDRCAVSVDGPPKESLSDQTRSGDVAATGPSAVFCPLWPARRRRSHPPRTATQVAARSAKIRCASPPTALSPRMIAATMATAIATPNHVDVRLSRAHCGDLRKHLATTKGATAATSSKTPRIEWTVACHDANGAPLGGYLDDSAWRALVITEGGVAADKRRADHLSIHDLDDRPIATLALATWADQSVTSPRPIHRCSRETALTVSIERFAAIHTGRLLSG